MGRHGIHVLVAPSIARRERRWLRFEPPCGQMNEPGHMRQSAHGWWGRKRWAEKRSESHISWEKKHRSRQSWRYVSEYCHVEPTCRVGRTTQCPFRLSSRQLRQRSTSTCNLFVSKCHQYLRDHIKHARGAPSFIVSGLRTVSLM
jgi:hypothetical protein